MLDSRIPFKNRWLAGVLAFLIPGAGHLYQGRRFKGILYFCCIVGMFFFGLHLGDWVVVYWRPDPTNFLNPYFAQVFVGMPALPALVQSRREHDRQNVDEVMLRAPLKSSFHGTLKIDDRSAGIPDGHLDGSIFVEPAADASDGWRIQGRFSGTLTPASGEPQQQDLRLGMNVSIGKPISADPDREFRCKVVENVAGNSPREIGRLSGDIPRNFWNWFEAPPDERFYDEMYRRLGTFYEVAMAFTMIAGLLNILVIFDAIDGPAYGYGDEQDTPEQSAEKTPAAPTPPQSASPPAVASQPAKSSTISGKT